MELSEYDIQYKLRLLLKGQVLANFIAQLPQTVYIKEMIVQWWILNMDGLSRASKFGIGILLQSSKGKQVGQAIQLGFLASNNESEYEAIIANLNLSLALSVEKVEVRSDSQLVVDQIQGGCEARDECMVCYLTLVKDRVEKLHKQKIQRVS